MDLNKLANEIIEGRRLTSKDHLEFLKNVSLESLSAEADRLRKHFSGDTVDLCSIISGKAADVPSTVNTVPSQPSIIQAATYMICWTMTQSMRRLHLIWLRA